jgi:hypothetical protein
VTDVLLPFIEHPGGKHNLARAAVIEAGFKRVFEGAREEKKNAKQSLRRR